MLNAYEQRLMAFYLANAASDLAEWIADRENRTAFGSRKRRSPLRAGKVGRDEGMSGGKWRSLQAALCEEYSAARKARPDRTARHRVEGRDERAEHGDLQVGFGQQARVGLVKVEELVNQIGSIGPAIAPIARVALDHRAVQLVHPSGGATVLRRPVQEGYGDDVRQEEHVDEVDQVIVPGARRHPGSERSDLVRHDSLKRGRHGKRRIPRPARDRTPGNVDEAPCVVQRETPGVRPPEHVAERLVLGAVGAQHRARCAEPCIEPAPVFVRAKVPHPVALDEAIGLGSCERRERAAHHPDAEYGAELQVAFGHETAHVPQQGKDIPGHRQAPGGWDGGGSHAVFLAHPRRHDSLPARCLVRKTASSVARDSTAWRDLSTTFRSRQAALGRAYAGSK